MAGLKTCTETTHTEYRDSGAKRGRGFAGMDPERQRQISSQGGKAAHALGRAHEFDSTEARDAGRKGGIVAGARRRAALKVTAGLRSGGIDVQHNRRVLRVRP